MKIILILLTVLTTQVNGQTIDIMQFDSLLITKTDTVFNKNGELFNGIIKIASDSSIKFAHYNNGLHLVDSSFYLTQKLKSVIQYNGKIETAKFLFAKNGNKFYEAIFIDSNRTLKQLSWWFPNGHIWKIENYKNGQKNGFWYEWYFNGRFLFHGEYKNEKKVGVWEYYSAKTGQLVKRDKY